MSFPPPNRHVPIYSFPSYAAHYLQTFRDNVQMKGVLQHDRTDCFFEMKRTHYGNARHMYGCKTRSPKSTEGKGTRGRD